MFYIIGFIRRTFLFGLIALPISIFSCGAKFSTLYQYTNSPSSITELFAAFLFWSIFAYPITVGLHLLMVKSSNKHRDLGEAYLSALGVDLSASFRYIGLFCAVVFGKHKIRDKSSFHDTCDFLQVLWGFIWTVLMTVFFTIGFVNIGAI